MFEALSFVQKPHIATWLTVISKFNYLEEITLSKQFHPGKDFSDISSYSWVIAAADTGGVL